MIQEKEVLLEELFEAKLQCSRLQKKLEEAKQEIAELLNVIKKKNAMLDRMQIRIDQGVEL